MPKIEKIEQDVQETKRKIKPENDLFYSKIILVLTVLATIVWLLMGIFNAVNSFYETKRAYFQNPIIIETRPFLVIEDKQLPIGETREYDEGVEIQAEDSKPVSSEVSLRSWTGQASYYSFNGCLGCSPTRTMANGQILDDSKHTVAFNLLPLGSMVEIENLSNGKTVVAEVTDTGGFERLGRVADLTVATKNSIGCTDLCNVKVTEVN